MAQQKKRKTNIGRSDVNFEHVGPTMCKNPLDAGWGVYCLPCGGWALICTWSNKQDLYVDMRVLTLIVHTTCMGKVIVQRKNVDISSVNFHLRLDNISIQQICLYVRLYIFSKFELSSNSILCQYTFIISEFHGRYVDHEWLIECCVFYCNYFLNELFLEIFLQSMKNINISRYAYFIIISFAYINALEDPTTQF